MLGGDGSPPNLDFSRYFSHLRNFHFYGLIFSTTNDARCQDVLDLFIWIINGINI
jgi:hypothetical protein